MELNYIIKHLESGKLSWYSGRLVPGRPGFTSQLGKARFFSTESRQALGATQPPIQSLFPGCKVVEE